MYYYLTTAFSGKRIILSLWLLRHDTFYVARIGSKYFNFMGDVFGKVSAISYYIIIEKQTDTSILLAAIFLIRELKIYIIVKPEQKF